MRNLAAAIAVPVSILVGIGILAHTYRTRNRANDLVVVTGLSRQDFDSDLIVWKGSFVRRAPELKAAYQSLAKDVETAKEFFGRSGLAKDEAVFSAVELVKSFDETTDNAGRTTRTFKEYVLTQRIRVEATDVPRIERFSRDVTGLIDAGVELYADPPEYYYTKLGALKLEMIAAATKDGRARAERIVQNAGGKLGPLRFSSLGVFQISIPNSSAETSWTGNFDVSSRRKTASITIKLQFGLS